MDVVHKGVISIIAVHVDVVHKGVISMITDHERILRCAAAADAATVEVHVQLVSF